MAFIKDRLLSMAMVLGIGFLLLVTQLLDTVIAAMGGYFQVSSEAVRPFAGWRRLPSFLPSTMLRK